MLRVLFVSSEGVPFVKTGGLADVVGSLSKALFDKGIDIRVIMPLYGTISLELKSKMIYKRNIYVRLGWRNQYCGIFECKLDGVIFYFIDNEYYFKREKIYGFFDEAERYAFFCKAVLESLPYTGFEPDVIHCHDWQTGLIPVFLEAYCRCREYYKNVRTLFTIHNLKYQGIFLKTILNELLNLSDDYFTPDKLEFNGCVNFMKGGIIYSNLLTTVSPTYSKEIQTEYYGEKLEGVLKARSLDLFGILNGIDYDEYDPETDKLIFQNYSIGHIEKKTENKIKLQNELGLDVSPSIPIIAMISRLTPQKGIDIIISMLDEIVSCGLELVILGTGEREYEESFTSAKDKYPGRISSNIKFDETLAHNIYAGADLFLMPSCFEPCGLGQMIALRYGTLPIVRETGGLKDTVISYNEFTMQGNGFSFTNYNGHDMVYTIKRALNFYNDKKVWNSIIANAMLCNFSWNASADKYIKLYEKLIGF